MSKRLTAIAAAAMAAASGNSVFAFASRKDALPSDEQLSSVLASSKMSEFSCKACGTSMHSLAGTSPFCVTCGSGEAHVHEIKANVKTPVTADSDLVVLQCSTCDHSTILESKVAETIRASTKGEATPVHCSCCGSPMFVVAEAEDGAASPAGMKTPDTAEDPSDDFPGPKVTSSKKLAKATKVKAEDAMDGMDDDIDLDDLDEVEANAENFGGKQAPPFKKGDSKASAEDGSISDNVLMTPDTPDILADDMVIEPFTVEEDSDFDMDPSPVVEEEFMAVADDDMGFPEPEGDPLIDALEMDDTDLALAFVKANGRVIAMKGHVAIASFSKASAGANAALMNSSALPVAAKAAVMAEGLRKGLASVGFVLINVPASANAVVARKVEAIRASVAKQEVDRKKDFANVFALAAAGLNRGNWKGYSNPLRAAVEQELSRLGVQAPKRVVSAIFEQAGVSYAQTLLEVSDRLSKLSASARKELETVLEMTTITSSSKDDSEDEEGSDVTASNLETRFAKPALLRPKVTSSAAGIAGASEILSGKASLSFASV